MNVRIVEPIRTNKKLIFVCTMLLISGGTIGFVTSLPAQPADVDQSESRSPGPDRAETSTPNSIGLFVNNLTVTLILLLGAVSLSIPTVIGLLYNGYILGGLASTAFVQNEIGVFAVLVFTHGIVELPALILAGAVSIRSTVSIYKHLKGDRAEIMGPDEIRQVTTLVGMSVLLLAVAAIIEGEVTVRLAEHLATR